MDNPHEKCPESPLETPTLHRMWFIYGYTAELSPCPTRGSRLVALLQATIIASRTSAVTESANEGKAELSLQDLLHPLDSQTEEKSTLEFPNFLGAKNI